MDPDVKSILTVSVNRLRRQSIFDEIVFERINQNAVWGEQNHKSFPDRSIIPLVKEEDVKSECEFSRENGDLNWGIILLEEVTEALNCKGSDRQLREELIQAAAVIVAWLECLDRNSDGR